MTFPVLEKNIIIVLYVFIVNAIEEDLTRLVIASFTKLSPENVVNCFIDLFRFPK